VRIWVFFFMLSVSEDWVVSDDGMICECELEGFQNECFVFKYRYYRRISLEGLKITTQDLSQDSQCFGRILICPPQTANQVLLLELAYLVMMY
jgi:hypothetical protein